MHSLSSLNHLALAAGLAEPEEEIVEVTLEEDAAERDKYFGELLKLAGTPAKA